MAGPRPTPTTTLARRHLRSHGRQLRARKRDYTTTSPTTTTAGGLRDQGGSGGTVPARHDERTAPPASGNQAWRRCPRLYHGKRPPTPTTSDAVNDPDNNSTLNCHDGDGRVARRCRQPVAANTSSPVNAVLYRPNRPPSRRTLASDAPCHTYNALPGKLRRIHGPRVVRRRFTDKRGGDGRCL